MPEESESGLAHLIEELEKPWQEKRVLKELYEERGLTYQEIANKVGCSQSNVYGNLLRTGLHEKVKNVELPEIPAEEPYKDAELMRELYIEEKLGSNVISALLDCANATVLKYLRKNDIPVRSASEGVRAGYGSTDPVVFYTHPDKGTECWAHSYESESSFVYVHRLVAIAEYGLEPVVENDVHHINEIRWDNRPENLTLMSRSEHSTHHRKIGWLDQLGMVEKYREGASSYDIAPEYGVTPSTVIRHIREFDPELVRDNGGEAA